MIYKDKIITASCCLSLFLTFIFKSVSGLGVNRVTSVERTYSGTNCLLFFTGASNIFQSNIYQEFIEVLESKNIDVYDVPFKYQISQEDIDEMYSESNLNYNSVNAIGHSSGCTTLLNQCCKLDGIKHVFLLDPVNTKLTENKWDTNDKFTSLSFIHAMKSYKITFEPFGLPFIPIFKLTPENLNVGNHMKPKIFDIDDYGHSDILNQPLSDFMHNTRMSVGNKNRGIQARKEYFDIILSFMLETIHHS